MNSESGGIPFLLVLGIVFTILKLTEVISWSWWLVLAPIWVPLAIQMAVVAVVAPLVLVAAFREAKELRARRMYQPAGPTYLFN